MQKNILKLSKDQYIILAPLSGRTVSVTSFKAHPSVEEFKGGGISKISYGDLPPIEVGEQIYLKNAPFRVELIEKKSNGFFLHSVKQSPSSYFLMPLLGETRDSFLWNSFFITSFLDVEDSFFRKEGAYLYLLYRFSKGKEYTAFENRVKSHPLFRGFVDPDPFHVLFFFEIPNEFGQDYETFIKGKYSRLTPNFKSAILNFHKSNNHSQLAKILRKDPKLRVQLEKEYEHALPEGAELYHRPEWKHETYMNRYKITKSIKENVEFE